MLTTALQSDIISSLPKDLGNLNDSVAQLDRAFDYESKGRRFESCRGHHRNADTAKNCGVFLFSGEQMSIWYGEYLGKNLITINNKQDLFL